MAFDTQAFINEILKDVQIDEAEKAALLKATGNPMVAKRLEESTLRQSEFSKLASEYQTKIRGAQEYWDGLVRWKNDEETKLKGQPTVDEGTESKTVKDFEAKLQQLAQEAVQYNNTLVTIGLRHMKEFGDVLDTDELLKVAARDKVSISIAHDRLVEPKRSEIRQTQINEQIAQARKEGAEEALKNVHIPVTDQPLLPAQPHSLDKFQPENKSEYGAMAAVKAFSDNRRKGIAVS